MLGVKKTDPTQLTLFGKVMMKFLGMLFDTPRQRVREKENWLKYNGPIILGREFVREKALELMAPQETIRALSEGIEQLHFDLEILVQAKKILSANDYNNLLDDLLCYKHNMGYKLDMWFEAYLHFNNLEYVLYSVNYPPLPGFYNVYTQTGKKLKGYKIPEQIYLFDSIWGYPEPENVKLNLSKPEKKSDINRTLTVEPKLYGEINDVCTLEYIAKQVQFPAKEMIEQLAKYYHQRNWVRLDYDLAVPNKKGGYLAGCWTKDFWSQCWIDSSDNVVNVSMRNSSSCDKDITVYVTYITNRHTKDALAYYRDLHKSSNPQNSDIYLPVGLYKDFRIFLFPRIGYKSSQEVNCFINLITGRWRSCPNQILLTSI